MLKKIIAYTLLTAHLGMIILTHLPAILYVCNYDILPATVERMDEIKSNKPQTGDRAYLQAIYKRAGDANDQAEKQTQPERIEVPGITFFIQLQEIIDFAPPICENKKFSGLDCKIPPAYHKIPSPPPKFLQTFS